jgi:hypothetical protein
VLNTITIRVQRLLVVTCPRVKPLSSEPEASDQRAVKLALSSDTVDVSVTCAGRMTGGAGRQVSDSDKFQVCMVPCRETGHGVVRLRYVPLPWG